MDGKVYNAPKVVSQFMQSNAELRVIMGPIGSGKSTGCVVEIVRRCKQQKLGKDGYRRSRWAVVRNTAPQLKDTTLKTWFDWVPAGVAGRWKESEKTFFLEFEDVRAEILFRPLDTPDDVQRVLSLELTGVWLNECREIPREILEALQGRIWRYPSKSNGGSSWCGIIADTNPPEEDSYWYNVIEHKPTVDEVEESIVVCDSFKQPSGLAPDADNVHNLDNPNYYPNLIRGKSEDWINTYVHGMYSPSQSGKPVYLKQFKSSIHVSPVHLIPNPQLPVIVGMDFGLTPAAVFMQMQYNGRIFILREAAEFDMGMKRFIELHLRPMSKNLFTDMIMVVIGDPAGIRRADTDEGSCFKTLKEFGFDAKPAHTNEPLVRIGGFMEAFMTYPDGEPMIVIDPRCTTLIAGLRSKYRYMKRKGSDSYTDKPEKNAWSHVVEAAQYGVIFFLNKYDPADFIRVLSMDGLNFTTTSTYRPADAHTGY